MSDKPAPRIGSSADLKRRNKVDPSLAYGKVQPQALDVEEVVLGAIMLDKDAISVVLDILQAESFYSEGHQAIYRAMLTLFDNNTAIDLITVNDQLRKTGELDKAGGPYRLVQLSNRVGSAANVEYHARIIAQKSIARELIKVSSEILRDAYDETNDVFDLLDEAEKGIFKITEEKLSRGVESIGELGPKALKLLEEIKAKSGDGLTGVPTGFSDLDKLTNGWQPSDLIILAARPGMGKTAFVLSIARNAAMDFNKGVAIFSLEMANVQLVQRLLSMEAGVGGHQMRSGQLSDEEWDRLQQGIERLSSAPLFIDDTPAINIFELRAKCRRLKMQHDIQMIVIDYLQLMSGSAGGKNTNREQEISTISRNLKQLAKEINVPVIALSQLSRAVEQRGGDKRPMLSDLRESGAIEQDADMVNFIYRPEYYDITEDEDGNSLKGVAKIIVAKNRHGELKDVQLKWIADQAKFDNWEAVDFDSFRPGNSPFTSSGFGAEDGSVTLQSRVNTDDEEIMF